MSEYFLEDFFTKNELDGQDRYIKTRRHKDFDPSLEQPHGMQVFSIREATKRHLEFFRLNQEIYREYILFNWFASFHRVTSCSSMWDSYSLTSFEDDEKIRELSLAVL